MQDSSRFIDRNKVITGALLICLGVILMLITAENSSSFSQALWVGLLAVGVFFYLWGRFFFRGSD
jgi:hypothetical protein